jgi:hypothetical protein
MTLARQFTAGIEPATILVREADGWAGTPKFNRLLHGLAISSSEVPAINCWAIPSRPLCGLGQTRFVEAIWMLYASTFAALFFSEAISITKR